ncbi:hypothetical protein [Acidovorax sp. 62]|uniref:hypothetical protein n=1 Tax=Acidovorax sp. 62 TaxID=2035203 RepID=UPI001177DD03|nr:hypothetical protein [Acidovorax sp. 62]
MHERSFFHGIAPGGCQIKTEGKGSNALAVQAIQQKRCPLSSALSGFSKGGAARQIILHRSGALGHGGFPEMVRALLQRIGTNTQTGARPQWYNEVAASKKQGIASQTKGAVGQGSLGMGAQPVAPQHEGLRLRVF